jgi:hypothetical protein
LEYFQEGVGIGIPGIKQKFANGSTVTDLGQDKKMLQLFDSKV